MRNLSRLFQGLLLLACIVSVVQGDNIQNADAKGRQAIESIRVMENADSNALSLYGQTPFYSTSNTVEDQRLVELNGSDTRLITWNEIGADGQTTPYYAISLDGGRTMARVTPTSYVLYLRYQDFDPAVEQQPLDSVVTVPAEGNLYIVQFITQPLMEFHNEITALGGQVYKFMSNHAYFVRMSPEVRNAVAALPYVRWIGPVQTAYKLEEEIRAQLASPVDPATGKPVEARRYSIMCNERGLAAQERVATFIRGIGGTVFGTTAEGYRLEAQLELEQVPQVAALDDVMFIDRKGEVEPDMDNVRELGGANYLETVAGYTGQGVRAEVCDTELNANHIEWALPPIIHLAGGSSSHGSSVYGIMFARGVDPKARGLLPSGQGIFAYSSSLLGGSQTRYTHTAELVNPAGPYRAVLQTNSTGDPQTSQYTSISADMDDMLFLYDITLTQSQSNTGNTTSRPQAWAKNIISGGAIKHYDTLTRDDDCWCGGGSIGPATDGRIKPDLCFFYDYTYTTSSSGGYTPSFGGTSGATPSVAGYTCLFYQMWADGLFGNEVDPNGDVFDNRCHMTTAKAVMINTANPYPFSGTSADLTRTHQGWGNPDVRYLYDTHDNMSIINETDILHNMESIEYTAYVSPGIPELRVTMTYADPMGVVGASRHRINDLTLKVESPSGTVYWGNNGLREGNWSTPGGVANVVDTVENVFVENPESGTWTVTVIASEVNEDSHTETPEVDADFALVVSGAQISTCSSAGTITLDKATYACDSAVNIRVVDCDLNTNSAAMESVEVTIESDSEPAGETVVLYETSPDSADFRGSIPLSTTNAVGVLMISAADTIVATYEDADNGTGVPATVTASATLDCVAPIVSNVQVTNIEPTSAVVTFDTNEPASGVVRYGMSCGNLNQLASQSGYGTSHSVLLSGLSEDTDFYFAIEGEDQAGNPYVDNNGGTCYMFTTPDIPNFFTELFSSNNDLDNISLIFVPNGSVDFYRGCTEPITALPTDPTGGTTVTLSDDSYSTVNLPTGVSVSLYGQSYTRFYIGSNGYVTFTAGDNDPSETLADHFDLPRISALFDDLYPPSGGTISWKRLDDRVAVTWLNIREITTGVLNTFQIEMFFNGEIHINYLTISISDGLAGLSAGHGVDPDFSPTDLSAMGTCVPPCPGDLDGDNDVDISDLATLLAHYGTTSGAQYSDGDLDGDGDVDVADLAALLAVYGHPC